ncbi:MAG: LysM peptidoglycan-binding domain-containing protein [Patescibacteria group bacterium]|nr:LysM peptidoglycan-binding domain-containing protein [Patescibacteria group bacterium]
MDEDGIPSEVSDIVSFRIDMSLPIFTDIEVTDTHIYSGEKFTFSFDTTGKVEKAIAFINDDEYLLTQDKKDKSRYIFSENMDLDLGEYPIEIDLYDIKLDSVHYTLPITLFIDEKEEVSSAVMTPSNTSDGDTTSNLDIQKFLDSIRKDADEVDTFVYIPSAVASVQVQADADGSRAFLSWTPATDDEQVVSYRIYYGTDKKFLPYTSQTSDARTSWYVDNLIPGTEYVFKVVAVDNRGNEGKVIQNSYTSIQLPLLIAGVDYPFEHRVQGGETLSSIAAQYHVALSSLASDNGVSDKDRVFPGQVLSIPLENQVDITEVELPKQTPNTGPEDWMLWIIVLLSLDVSLRLYSMKKS